MVKKFLFRVLVSVIVLVVIAHLILLYLGLASVVTAIIIYALFFVVVDRMLAFFLKDKWKKHGARISFWMLFVGLLLTEFTLRYVTRTHLSYSELSGKMFYTCPYTQARLDNIGRKYFLKQADVGIKVDRPNETVWVQNSEFSYPHKFNSLGLREHEFSDAEIDSSYVILGLGDSFTEGVGAPEDSTWIHLLQANLRPEIPKVLGIDGGSNGSDVVFETYKLKNLLYDKYKPQMVILAINQSDIQDIIFRGGTERFVSKSTLKYNSGPWWKYLYAFSHVFRLVVHEGFGVNGYYYTDKEYEKRKAEAKQVILNEIEQQLIPYAQEKGFKLMLVFTPVLSELQDSTLNLQSVYDAIPVSDDVMKLNMFSAFNAAGIKQFGPYFWLEDGHNNSKGYAFWADRIAQKIEESKQP